MVGVSRPPEADDPASVDPADRTEEQERQMFEMIRDRLTGTRQGERTRGK